MQNVNLFFLLIITVLLIFLIRIKTAQRQDIQQFYKYFTFYPKKFNREENLKVEEVLKKLGKEFDKSSKKSAPQVILSGKKFTQSGNDFYKAYLIAVKVGFKLNSWRDFLS